MVKRLAKNISPTKETEAELVEHVVSEWCKMHHVDPKSHMAVMEGLRVLYMMREFDMTDRDELLKELLCCRFERKDRYSGICTRCHSGRAGAVR
ncbi:hypothetical protein [Sinorhizobium fredii]|uniref:hypothetical protein n=1 Tax=Rhizobium fredii TaxID=380 RepID=UPI001F1F432E|nr:hypothetical protein [Sinorhizobium fredii]